METEFKIHPSIAWNHPPHTAIKKLVEEHDIKPDEVEKVIIKGLGAERIADYNPAGPVDAMFSLPYTVATTILREKLLPDMYSEEKIKNPQVQSLLKRIIVEPDPDADRLWFEEHKEVFSIDIYLKGGKRLNTHVEYPKDKPACGKKEIEQKFRDLASLTLSADQVEKVIETVERLDRLDGISELAKLLQ